LRGGGPLAAPSGEGDPRRLDGLAG